MGAGKTTVIAPLLALMLGDGESLVLSVVPKALLDMSRNVRVQWHWFYVLLLGLYRCVVMLSF